jgi:DNA-binding transcriptional regulator YhcF (GntR family)
MGRFHLPIDRRSPEPVFRQICKQVKELVDSGRLPTGTRLPPTRDLARDAGEPGHRARGV